MPSRLYRSIAIAALSVITMDQVVKSVIVEWLGREASQHRWEVAGRLVAFEYVENTGAAFGLFSGRPWLVFGLAVGVTLLFFVLAASRLEGNQGNALAAGLILGGAGGNLLDRVRLGYVIDFIAIGTWPKFNVADMAVTFGVVAVVLVSLRDERRAPQSGHLPPEQSGDSSSMGVDSHHERNGVAR